jgi:hypothetical protein
VIEGLDDLELWQLAQFLKRVSFNTCLQHTDNSNTKAQAYAMIAGLEAVRGALAKQGYSPR